MFKLPCVTLWSGLQLAALWLIRFILLLFWIPDNRPVYQAISGMTIAAFGRFAQEAFLNRDCRVVTLLA